jgi:hypothetical protein
MNSEKGRAHDGLVRPFGIADMKAVLAPAYGGPEVLTLEDVDRPTPEAGQVLVEVHVVGKAVIVVAGP